MRSPKSCRKVQRADPLRAWPRIQAAIFQLRACPNASLLGLPVSSLVRLTQDLRLDHGKDITPDMLRQAAELAASLGLFRQPMNESEWLECVQRRTKELAAVSAKT